MAVRPRPLGYGLIDQAYANQSTTDRELPMATGGWPEGSTPRAVEGNHSFSRYGNWAQFFDQRTPILPVFFGTQSSRTSVLSFTFDTGVGLLGTVQDDSSYVVTGYAVDLSIAVLASYGVSTWLFAATKDTHVYAHADGTLRFSAVTIGVMPAPATNELWLGTMRTNATDRVTWTSGTDTPDMFRILVSGTSWDFEAPLTARHNMNWIRAPGSTRVHKRQNQSASAKGYTLSDTRTHEGVTGNGLFLPVLAELQLPNNGRIIIQVHAAAVEQGVVGNFGYAVWQSTRYLMTTGSLTVEGGNAPTFTQASAILAGPPILDLDANNIGIYADFGASVCNVEISFKATVISA